MTPPDISQETVRQFLAMLVVTKTSIESKLDLFSDPNQVVLVPKLNQIISTALSQHEIETGT